MWTCSASTCSPLVLLHGACNPLASAAIWADSVGTSSPPMCAHWCPAGREQLLPGKHQASGSTASRSKSQKVKLKLMSDLGFQPGAFVPSWRPLLGAVHWRELVSHHEIHLTPWHQLGPGSKPSLPCPPDQQASLGAAQCARAPRFRWIAAKPAVLVTEVTEGQKWCNNT